MKKRFVFLLLSFVLTNFPAFWPAFAQAQNKVLIIPEGTQIQLSMRESVSSKLNEVGDEVQAVVKTDVIVDGVTLLKEGTLVIGRITVAKPAKRPLKGGMLHISFNRIRLQDGLERKLVALVKSASDYERDEKISSTSEGTLKGGKFGGEDPKSIGALAGIGATAATIIILSGRNRGVPGLGLGGISGGSAVAAVSVLGATVVAGILLTKGKEVRLDAGSLIRLQLERPLSIE